MMITKDENKQKIVPNIGNLKLYLSRNDIKEIANEVGVTTRTVSNVIHGRSKNWAVAAKIAERVEKRKAVRLILA